MVAMDLIALIAVATVFLLYVLVSGKLAGTIITAPIIFAAAGFLLGPAGFDIGAEGFGHSFLHVVAELTLILVLFAALGFMFIFGAIIVILGAIFSR